MHGKDWLHSSECSRALLTQLYRGNAEHYWVQSWLRGSGLYENADSHSDCVHSTCRTSAPWNFPSNVQSMPWRLLHLLSCDGSPVWFPFSWPFLPDSTNLDIIKPLDIDMPSVKFCHCWQYHCSSWRCCCLWALYLWCAKTFVVSKLCSVAKWTCEMLVFHILLELNLKWLLQTLMIVFVLSTTHP